MASRIAKIGRQPTPARAKAETQATDRELLQRFARQDDQAAFEALFQRHSGMVLGIARQVLGNTQDAEDVCQAAFLLLAQKAASQKWHASVANWLHKTARLLALKARQTAARRARREGRAARPASASPLADMTGQELLGVLDEELLRLPEALRAPLVLCYLQGATRDEAAQRLGCPLATLKNRLERGRDQLQAALLRRGLGLSAVLFAALLNRQAAAALSGRLARQTAIAARDMAAGQPLKGLVSPTVSELVQGGLGMLSGTKLKGVLGLLLLGGLLSTLAAHSAGDEKPPPPPAVKASPDPKAEAPAEPAVRRSLRVRVVDADGKPVEKANIHVSVWTDEPGFPANRDLPTDAAGVAVAELPRSYAIVRLWAVKPPFVTMFAGWEQNELAGGSGLPAEYTFRLEPGTRAGGRVVDEQGKPIAGARVQVELRGDVGPARGDGRARYNTWLAEREDAATTDAEGRWHIENVPADPRAELSLTVSHPDFIVDGHRAQTRSTLDVSTAALRHESATITLKRGVVVRGQVTDPAGKPVGNAVVIVGDDPYSSFLPRKFPTDADGQYRLPALPPGRTTLTVMAAGWAPQLRKVELAAGLPAQDFRLQPGKPIRLRIVDGAGKPVTRAYVAVLGWKGSQSIQSGHNPNHPKVPDTKVPHRADAQGVWEWTSAPDGPVKLRVDAPGFVSYEFEAVAGAPERTLALKAEHRVTGRVTDAATGLPIPAFIVIPVDVFRKDWLHAERHNGVAGKNGRLDYLATRTDIPLRLRVEAVGYRTQDGPEFRVGDESARTQDFRLQPSPPVTGSIVDAGGRPAAGALVQLAVPTESARLDSGLGSGNHTVAADSQGRFTFPDPSTDAVAVAQAEAGFARADVPAGRHDVGTLRLRPWASVRGRFLDGGKPVQGATVFVQPVGLDSLDRPRLEGEPRCVTDAEGRFTFERLPPIPVNVWVGLGPWRDEGFRSGPRVPLDLRPGQKVDLDLGAGGATVTGKVKLTGKVPADLDCTYALNYLVSREPGITPPAEVAAAGFDARKGWRDSWNETREGLAYLSTLRSWFVKLAPDGSFRICGVPPGEYDLAVRVYVKPTGCLVDPLARQVVRVKVTPADVQRGALQLPEVAATVVPTPAVGDVPDLSFHRPDGKRGRLADCRGRLTVVHFWASWCGPCKKQLPELRKVQERFASRGIALLGLSLDEDASAWQDALKGLDPSWPQGRLAGGGAPGVSSVPAYWVLDPAGKIVAKASDPDEVAAAIVVLDGSRAGPGSPDSGSGSKKD